MGSTPGARDVARRSRSSAATTCRATGTSRATAVTARLRGARATTSSLGRDARAPFRTRWSTGSRRRRRDADRAWLRDEVRASTTGGPSSRNRSVSGCSKTRSPPGGPRFEDVGALFTRPRARLGAVQAADAERDALVHGVPLMALAGIVYVDEAMATPPMRRFLERFLSATRRSRRSAEIPGHPARGVRRRPCSSGSGTRACATRSPRLCIDGTAKFPKFLVPTIERQLELGGPVECAALALAGWARYLATTPAAERATDAGAERAASVRGAVAGRSGRVSRLRPGLSPRRCARASGFAMRSGPRSTAWPRTARSARSKSSANLPRPRSSMPPTVPATRRTVTVAMRAPSGSKTWTCRSTTSDTLSPMCSGERRGAFATRRRSSPS